MFFDTGFTINTTLYRPCRVMYHPQCVKVGPPFSSRHFGKGTNGLQFPPCATIFPFICELCTVRTQAGRELDPHIPSDFQLLRLERMRMIDAAHAWAPRTLQNACGTIRRTDKFYSSVNLPSTYHQLQLPSLLHPPLDISIPVFWCMESHTSTPSSRSQGLTPSWNSSRIHRSALSLYSAWTAAFCFPHNHYRDNDKRVLSASSVSPSDNILSRFTASGLGSRLGTESRPSQALTYAHITWNQKYRSTLLRSCTSLHASYELVGAQCVELIAWLGWLRASELFNLKMNDVELVPPKHGAIYGLPPNVGAIFLKLLPSTKSSRNKQVDVVIAWTTSSGLCLGYWLSYLFQILHRLNWASPSCCLFRSNTSSSKWTSHYFRTNHLYPLLHLQYLEGDVTLRHINTTSSFDIPYHFYSMHSYRRGAETFPTRKRSGCKRKATITERINHGRWRIKNTGSEDMPTHYSEPSIEDRIFLTLLCY